MAKSKGKGRIKYKEAWTVQTPNNQHHHLLEINDMLLFHINKNKAFTLWNKKQMYRFCKIICCSMSFFKIQ